MRDIFFSSSLFSFFCSSLREGESEELASGLFFFFLCVFPLCFKRQSRGTCDLEFVCVFGQNDGLLPNDKKDQYKKIECINWLIVYLIKEK